MTVTKITFQTSQATQFVAEIKQRVAEYFESRKLSDKADAWMVVKTVVLWTAFVAPFVLILTNRFSPLAMLGLCVLMGVGMAGIGFSVAHDALHGAYSARPWVNKLLGYSFDAVGANGYMWKITHNVIHHTYTNIHGIDEDLEVSPLLRLSPQATHRWFQRYQHYYAWFAYGFATLFWVFVKDFKYFLQRDLGPYQDKKHPPVEIATLIIGKLFYYGWAIVLPLLVLNIPWWQFAIGFVTMHLTAGLILGVIFQLAHVVESTEHLQPDPEGLMGDAWLVHEMRTTANFARKNRLLSWYIGGLNFQIEHHLFPRTCSIHYPALSGIVQGIAEKYGIPYNDQPTLRSAIASHYRMLKTLGAARQPQAAGELALL